MQLIDRTKRTIIALASSVLLLMPSSFPLVAFAEDCVTTSAPQGTQLPRGSDADTYSYNSCGYWENDHYTWNPVTFVTSPKDSPSYNYNGDTGLCDYKVWNWSPASGSWYQSTESVTIPPNDEPCIGKPVPQAIVELPAVADPNSVDTNSTNNQTVNDTTNSTLNNTIASTAVSGNAILLGNVAPLGSLGGATSGSAQAIANVFNLLQSSSSLGAGVTTFVANINGDVQGDLVVDPGQLQPASVATDLNNNLDVNLANNGSITNNINLAAQSGDATVSENVNAGNATSGNAAAIANVVNMMNSLVSANQSFLGVININGNLNGNILMPQNFLDALIASNAPHENVAVSQDTLNQLTANVDNNTAIANNVKSTAASGKADASYNVNNNGPLSSAQSGKATTNVTIFNLVNHQITAGNTMLVFVNVSGTWVGVIMDAPAGATAAALGGGVINNSVNNTANYDVTNNGSITNNIDVSALSGDAAVTKNVNAGNAKSGDARTVVNLANISNSSINLNGWFGILFINVFGNWNGNFGILPNPPAPDNAAAAASTGQMFSFVAAAQKSGAGASGSGGTGSNSQGLDLGAAITTVAEKVLGATTINTEPKLPDGSAAQGDLSIPLIIGAGLFVGGILLAGADLFRSRRHA